MHDKLTVLPTFELLNSLRWNAILEVDLAVNVSCVVRVGNTRIRATSRNTEARGIKCGLGCESAKNIKKYLDVSLGLLNQA
jgi:hypothetical protein